MLNKNVIYEEIYETYSFFIFYCEPYFQVTPSAKANTNVKLVSLMPVSQDTENTL